MLISLLIPVTSSPYWKDITDSWFLSCPPTTFQKDSKKPNSQPFFSLICWNFPWPSLTSWRSSVNPPGQQVPGAPCGFLEADTWKKSRAKQKNMRFLEVWWEEKKQQVANCGGFRICKVWFFLKKWWYWCRIWKVRSYVNMIYADAGVLFEVITGCCKEWSPYSMLDVATQCWHPEVGKWFAAGHWTGFFFVFAAVAHNLRALREVDLT